MEKLTFPLLVTMQRNNTGVVSVSMGIFDYGYLVMTRLFIPSGSLMSCGPLLCTNPFLFVFLNT
jgi:hypothetical protein